MGNFREKLERFMSGRYGMDGLNKSMMGLYVVLMIVNAFIKTPVLNGVVWVVVAVTFYRMYSRDIEKRSRENEAFLKFSKPVRRKLSMAFRRIKGMRTYRYRACPNCKATIELPLRKGSRTITCPRCRTDFEIRIIL